MSLGNIKIRTKLGLIVALSVIGLMLTASLGLYALNSSLHQGREMQTQNLVGSVYSVLESLNKEVSKGHLTLEEAKMEAKEIVGAMRYGDNDYFWLNDLDHVVILHPIKPSLNGRNLEKLEDPNGVRVYGEIVNRAKQDGEGYVSYHWPKPGSDKPVSKLAFVKLYEPWGWVIGTGIYMDDVSDAFWTIAIQELQVLLVISIIMIVVAIYIARDIRHGITTMAKTMKHLSEGATDIETPMQERKDAIGNMAKEVEYFRTQLIENEKMAERQRQEEEAQHQRAALIEQLATDFDAGINVALGSVASAASQLDTTASSMSSTAQQTSTQATVVAGASEETANNVQTVAAASEELTASIQEVGQQVQTSTDIAQSAAHKAQETQITVNSLSDTASRISQASALIGDIAEQTNMLALNATIEAARAGDAGKGFAVVANEVKSLATQTARATEEINAHVRAIQTVSYDTVEAISEINNVIEDMNNIASAVAAAVEEQSAATSEIARNIEQAAAGTQEVNRNIIEVNQAANDTGAASQQVLSASSMLNDQSVSLRKIVEDFLGNVKSA
ncbi:Methyl-accepting chemotaxis protein [Candidatus Terasakiella magnetica]|uniref:Methyl-accepting chemotaxis protein n=1 Tax=Candidatus Terasakiella magnetica TaxID=1867952 RepID=A0A1C3RJ70_9PROT|nr:cache domain-containing protein [Candidatus Terasakiella magnetica]SCA57308.1 Methyl-accepting chemotaxis protein [Candidatus Terasakiella magnetica]